MTPEQQHWHQLMMSPQIENVELAFQLIQSQAVEIDLKPYKDLLFIWNILNANWGLDSHVDKIFTPTMFHHARNNFGSTLMANQINHIGDAPPVYQSMMLLGKIDCSLLNELNFYTVFCTDQFTFKLALRLKTVQQVYIKGDLRKFLPNIFNVFHALTNAESIILSYGSLDLSYPQVEYYVDKLNVYLESFKNRNPIIFKALDFYAEIFANMALKNKRINWTHHDDEQFITVKILPNMI